LQLFFLYIYIYIYIYICLFVYLSSFLYIYIYIYIYLCVSCHFTLDLFAYLLSFLYMCVLFVTILFVIIFIYSFIILQVLFIYFNFFIFTLNPFIIILFLSPTQTIKSYLKIIFLTLHLAYLLLKWHCEDFPLFLEPSKRKPYILKSMVLFDECNLSWVLLGLKKKKTLSLTPFKETFYITNCNCILAFHFVL